ncbi:MAG: head-tail adaptor protein [Alphaproteobacteria bacterium]|nr:head-tail adaptor protein [Alphaproteobacteria bacterium]
MPNRGAGALRETVAFEVRVAADDGRGNRVGAFTEQFRCAAGFNWLRGGEAVMASRLQGVQPMIARVWATPDTRKIGGDWQMRDIGTGQVYAVQSAVQHTNRQWIDVMVKSGIAS